MKHTSITAALAALALAGAAGAADAQVRATSAIQKPAVTPTQIPKTTLPASSLPASSGGSASAFMAAGPYRLQLHPLKKNGHTVSSANSSASDAATAVGVSRTGNSITITASQPLTGTVTGNQFTASGTESGVTLTLRGSPGGTVSAATGSFTYKQSPDSVTGTFNMYAGFGPSTTQKKIQQYGEGGGGSQPSCGLKCMWDNFWAGLHW